MAWRDEMREAASDMWSIPHERAATKQIARQAFAHAGFDDMAPSMLLLALRICTSYSTRLAPNIRGHLVRNAAHERFCIRLLDGADGVVISDSHAVVAHGDAGRLHHAAHRDTYHRP